MKRNTQLKRSGFKRPSFEEIKQKQAKRAVRAKNTGKVAKRPKYTKGKSMAWYKKELDRVFSLYVRKIYPKVCYTCGKQAERLQCGHYISRQYLATRWSIENCRPQCWGCNGYGKGQPLIFEEKLKAEYGNDFVEKLKASRHQIIKLDIPWYMEAIEKYKQHL